VATQGDGWLSIVRWVAMAKQGDGWLSIGRWLATQGDGWLSIGGWVAKQGDGCLSWWVHLIATAALWVRIQTSPKLQNGQHKERSGQLTLARPKKYTKTVICAIIYYAKV
jgi:hypothetical protein